MHKNYVEVVDGMPTGRVSLRDKSNDDETWLPFDADSFIPRALMVRNGVIVEDTSKRAAYNDEITKNADREVAYSSSRSAGISKLISLGLTAGEVKALFHEKPTDAELGI